MANIASATMRAFGGLGRRAGGFALRHRGPIAGLGLATLVGGTAVGLGAHSVFQFEQSIARAAETHQMSQLILSAQGGPFGPSAKRLGISSNNNNTAGLTLAAHYAKNRSKRFGVLGLKFL